MKKRSSASKFAAVLMASTLVLAACGDDESSTATTGAPAPETTAAPAPETTGAPAPETTGGTADPLAALYQECLDNGAKVNLIALPDEWANYKGILQSFRDKYPGVENPVASPDASSKEEMEAVQTLAGQADMPDNVDVSPAIAQEMVDAGLFEPYVLTSDAEIPAGLKDAANNWTAAYYGIMAIATNTTIVPTAPKSFADLTKPEYKGLVALNGDPREAGSAFAAVMAASLANGGSADDIMPGIQFFADLKKSGNLGGTDVTKETVLSGETPIAIDWSYNVPGLKADLEA
ncbi:MAG: hypothetical protein RI900_1267, partial [Actinomycetota bacterium]